MKSKGIRTCLTIGISIVVLAIIFVAGIGVGYYVPRLLGTGSSVPDLVESTAETDSEVTPSIGDIISEATESISEEETPVEYEDLFAPFWETWDIVHELYVDQPVDDLTLMRGAIPPI